MSPALSQTFPPIQLPLDQTKSASRMQLVSPVSIIVGMAIVLNVLGKLVRKLVFVPKLTIMDDLPSFGQKRKDGKIAGRAVICGGR